MGWEQIINIRGENGKHAELRTTATHIQWRQTDGEVGGPWIDLVTLDAITGPEGGVGAPGSGGADGRSVELRRTATHVQWRRVGDATWIDLVPLADIVGPPGGDGADGAVGAAGTDGRSVELRRTDTHIQWRLDGDTGWDDLVALADIAGPPGEDGGPGDDGAAGVDGRSVEVRRTATHIQWRLVGDTAWTDLVALADITGPPGDGVDVTWDTLPEKPAVFPPADHTHPSEDVTGLDAALTALQETVDGKVDGDDPRLSNQRIPTDGSVTDAKVATGISADKVADSTAKKMMTAAERTKLAAVAAGATANATNAELRDRGTHTGTQPSSSISDFVAAVSAIVQTAIGAAPEALDTLAEIAAALNDDPDFAATITAALAQKEATIAPGTTAQYLRGDKTWQTLNKAAVALGNADNTSDAAKPVSTAQQAAINARVPATRMVAGKALSADVTLTKGDVGLGNADNTSDAGKPLSTAAVEALNGKADSDHDHPIGDVTGLQTALDGMQDEIDAIAPANVRVFETFAAAPPLPADTVVISRTGL